MNIRFGNKANLIELAEDLREVCAHRDQPAPYDWEKIRQLLEDNAQYLETYIIPRTPEEEAGYKSGSPKIAAFVTPPSRADLEVRSEDSSVGAPFMPGEKVNGAR